MWGRWLPSLAFLGLLLMATPATAGWLDAVRQRLTPSDGSPSSSFADVVAVVKALPETEALALAAEAGEDGHWRLANRAGEPCSAATPDELTRCLATLLGAIPQGGVAPLVLYLTEASVFRHASALRELPASTRLKMLSGGDVLDLLQVGRGGDRRWYARISQRQLLEAKDRREFLEARRQLAGPVATRRVRVLALEPGAGGTLGRSRPPAGAGGAIPIETVDPDQLRHLFWALRGDTALIVGRIEGERLVFQPSSGAERSVLLKDYTAAAAAYDAELLIVGSVSARQPGSRNWLWLKTGVGGLETSLKAATLGEALTGLVGDGEPLAISATTLGDGTRVRLVARPIQRAGGPSTLDSVIDVLSDIFVSGLSRTATVVSVEADLVGSARSRELAARIIPGIPAVPQLGYLIALLLGVPGFAQLRRWWAIAWPPESRADYGAGAGWMAAKGMRELLFVTLFMPLLGIWATLWQALRLFLPRTSGRAAG